MSKTLKPIYVDFSGILCFGDNMKKIKFIARFVLFIIFGTIFAGLIGFCLLCLTYLIFPEDEYAKSSEWSCDNETFSKEYLDIYISKLEELQAKHGIICELRITENNDNGQCSYDIYLSNDEFAIHFILRNNKSFGEYTVRLEFYDKEINSLYNYDKQRNAVNFINEFTHYVAFDTKHDECENHFERLYLETVQNQNSNRINTYIYHQDDLVGNIGYSISTPYIYKSADGIETAENYYLFEGLLKPLQ